MAHKNWIRPVLSSLAEFKFFTGTTSISKPSSASVKEKKKGIHIASDGRRIKFLN